jgi:hypothetical protein
MPVEVNNALFQKKRRIILTLYFCWRLYSMNFTRAFLIVTPFFLSILSYADQENGPVLERLQRVVTHLISKHEREEVQETYFYHLGTGFGEYSEFNELVGELASEIEQENRLPTHEEIDTVLAPLETSVNSLRGGNYISEVRFQRDAHRRFFGIACTDGDLAEYIVAKIEDSSSSSFEKIYFLRSILQLGDSETSTEEEGTFNDINDERLTPLKLYAVQLLDRLLGRNDFFDSFDYRIRDLELTDMAELICVVQSISPGTKVNFLEKMIEGTLEGHNMSVVYSSLSKHYLYGDDFHLMIELSIVARANSEPIIVKLFSDRNYTAINFFIDFCVQKIQNRDQFYERCLTLIQRTLRQIPTSDMNQFKVSLVSVGQAYIDLFRDESVDLSRPDKHHLYYLVSALYVLEDFEELEDSESAVLNSLVEIYNQL